VANWLWLIASWVDLLADLKNVDGCQECMDKQDLNFQKDIYGKSFHTMSFQAILL
jgi:hypothetical protein